jgi:hypothetical protein
MRMLVTSDLLMLIIGIGGTGSRVAESVHTLLKDSNIEIQVFEGQPKNPGSKVPARIRSFGLPLDEARSILLNGQAWKRYLHWLPASRDYQVWDELVVIGAGGQRWLGRMAFIAGAAGVKEVLRSRFEILEGKGEGFKGVVLVASLGGGTGSGLLADMTHLVRRLSPDTPRIAYLLLPGEGGTEGSRLQANAYATLKELFFLKYQTLPFEAEYPGVGSVMIPSGGAEPWQRLFLFAPNSGERPPYAATLNRIALAIAAHARSALWRAALEEAHREVELTLRGIPRDVRQRSCFSSCGFLQSEGCDLGIPKASQEGGPAAASTTSVERRFGNADDGERMEGLRELYVRRPAYEAASQFGSDLREKVKSLDKKCESAKGDTLTKMLQEIDEVADSLEAFFPDSRVQDQSGLALTYLSPVSWFKRLFSRWEPKESSKTKRDIKDIREYDVAARKIQAGLVEFGLSVKREGVWKAPVLPKGAMPAFEPRDEDKKRFARDAVELRRLIARGPRAFGRQTLRSILAVLDDVL